jgi:hypothetical protein
MAIYNSNESTTFNCCDSLSLCDNCWFSVPK